KPGSVGQQSGRGCDQVVGGPAGQVDPQVDIGGFGAQHGMVTHGQVVQQDQQRRGLVVGGCLAGTVLGYGVVNGGDAAAAHDRQRLVGLAAAGGIDLVPEALGRLLGRVVQLQAPLPGVRGDGGGEVGTAGSGGHAGEHGRGLDSAALPGYGSAVGRTTVGVFADVGKVAAVGDPQRLQDGQAG